MTIMLVNNGYGGATNQSAGIPGKYVSWPDAKLRATPPPAPAAPQLSLARPYVPKARPTSGAQPAQFDGSLTANIHPPKPSATVA